MDDWVYAGTAAALLLGVVALAPPSAVWKCRLLCVGVPASTVGLVGRNISTAAAAAAAAASTPRFSSSFRGGESANWNGRR